MCNFADINVANVTHFGVKSHSNTHEFTGAKAKTPDRKPIQESFNDLQMVQKRVTARHIRLA